MLPSYVMPHDPLTGVLDHRIETYELKNKFPTCMTVRMFLELYFNENKWTPNGNRILVGNSKGKISMIDSTNFSQHEVNVHVDLNMLRAIMPIILKANQSCESSWNYTQ